MSVTINGTVCRTCWDVDWARKVEREQTEKHAAEARKAQEAATTPPGSAQDISGAPDQASGLDSQPATILGGSLKGAAASDGVTGNAGPIVAAASSAPGQSINIFA